MSGTKAPGIALLSLLWLAIVSLAAPLTYIKNSEEFGFVYEHERGVSAQQDLTVTAFEDEIISYEIASRVGGVILQATARPDQTATGKALALRYEASRPDGNRLSGAIGGQSFTADVPDWAFVPIARLVASPWTAAISLLGQPKNASEQVMRLLSNAMFVEIHPSLRNTVVANNFLFTDAMLVAANPNRMRRVTENISEKISGYSGNFDEDRSRKAANSIQSIMQSDRVWDSYIFTDLKVDFTFGIDKARLKLTGDPYYLFVDLNARSRTVRVDSELTDKLRNSKLFDDLNPSIYKFNREAFQLAAFFRAAKAGNPSGWAEFAKSISGIEVAPSMATPRAWTPE